MGVRKVGRCRVTVNGRDFVWWMHNEGESIRIASDDKQFVVAYQLYCPAAEAPLLRVSGPEFPGVDPREVRPVYLVPPKFERWYSFKGLARRIIEWSLSDGHEFVRPTTPPERTF